MTHSQKNDSQLINKHCGTTMTGDEVCGYCGKPITVEQHYTCHFDGKKNIPLHFQEFQPRCIDMLELPMSLLLIKPILWLMFVWARLGEGE